MAIETRTVAIIGAGTLGRYIGYLFAQGACRAQIYDVSEEMAAGAVKAIRERLGESGHTDVDVTAAGSLAEAVENATLVIEAISERLEAKVGLFSRLEALTDPNVILASNSSSMPIAAIASELRSRRRVLNMHFYNNHKIVELMPCAETDEAIAAHVASWLRDIGLQPVVVRAESVGFVYNRIWAAIKREALNIVASGVSEPDEVDRVFRELSGTTWGPFQLMDSVGLDVVLDIEKYYVQRFPELAGPGMTLLEDYVSRGDLGRKTGVGFYSYEGGVTTALA